MWQGRASRSEFWWFLPVGIVPPLLLTLSLDWQTIEIFGVWRIAAVMAASFPLLSAGSRRLQDAGEDGALIVMPFMPFFTLWAIYFSLLIFAVVVPYLGWVTGLLALGVLPFAHLIALVISVLCLAHVLGLALVPSTPGDNAHGAKPNGASA